MSLYFKSDDDLEFSCGDYFVQDVPNGDYLVARIRGIKAAHIGDRLPLKVNGNKAVTYSPLNYCKNALDDNAISDNLKNAIKAFYLYYNAADEYFNVIDLGTVTGDIVVQNSGVITGTLSGNHKISIADGATVRLRNANITSLANDEYYVKYAGITLLGDATIILEGTNTVKGGYKSYPGIYVPEGKTLTIDGNGSLVASSQGYACGIGGGAGIRCGNITIDGGNITATGGVRAAGIGGVVLPVSEAVMIQAAATSPSTAVLLQPPAAKVLPVSEAVVIRMQAAATSPSPAVLLQPPAAKVQPVSEPAPSKQAAAISRLQTPSHRSPRQRERDSPWKTPSANPGVVHAAP